MGQPLIWPLQKVVSNHHTDFFLLPNSLCKTTIKTLKYKNHKKFIKNESSLNLIKSYEVVWYEQQKTKTSVLIPLSQLAGAGNFCFKSLPPFLLTACILSFQAISLQILLYALFPQFSWSILLPFPGYFKLHNLMYLGVDVWTDDMTMPRQTVLNYHIFYLVNNSQPVLTNIS